jgi:hypothetical protein
MARWEPGPSEPIGPAEHVARRIFDEPQLVGATDQKPFAGLLDIRIFEETRGDEFLVDRMGKTSVDKRVKAYLKPLAEAAGQNFQRPKRFDGWATAPSMRVSSPARGAPIPLVASPGDGNPYHAHLVTANVLPGAGLFRHYHVALFMRELFTGPGTSIHLSQPQTTKPADVSAPVQKSP